LRFRIEYHVDLEASTLQVSYALQRIKRPGKEKSRLELIAPKTDCSRRIIRLPQVAVSALHAHRARQEHERQVCGLRWRETGMVFTTSIGTMLDQRNMTCVTALQRCCWLKTSTRGTSWNSWVTLQSASP
jgi:hypothetical protein